MDEDTAAVQTLEAEGIALVFNLAQQYTNAPTTLKANAACDKHKHNGRLLFIVGNLALEARRLRDAAKEQRDE